MTNQAWVITRASRGVYKPDCLRLEQRPAERPHAGQLLLRTIYLSLDPTSRNWLKLEPSSNFCGLEVGSVMIGQAVSAVEESAADGFQKGDIVVGLSGWEHHSIVPADRVRKVIPDVPLEANLTIFSHIGNAAMTGMVGIGKVQAGDIVVVSAAAGATGSLAAQIAKARGAHVIGIAGGAEKCRLLVNEMGLDAAINYKSDDVSEALLALCPEGVDLFFDNVGGAILDAVLMNLAENGRIAVCGQVALYNSSDQHDGQGVRNLMELVFRKGRMEGFLAGQFPERDGEFNKELLCLYRDGKIASRGHFIKGIERSAEALDLLFTGANDGKLIVEVSAP